MGRTCFQGALVGLTVVAWSVVVVCAAEAQEIQANRGVSIEPDPAAALVTRDEIGGDRSAAERRSGDNGEGFAPTQRSVQQPASDSRILSNGPAIETRSAEADTVKTVAAPVSTAQPLPPAPQESLPLGRVPDDESAASTGISGGSDPGSIGGGWLLSTAAALAIVLGLIYVAKLCLQRLGGVSGVGGNAPGMIEVLSRSSIGPKTSVMFLRVGKRVVVVAQSGAGLQTLTELDDPDEVAELIGSVQAARPKSITNGFRSLLGRFDNQFETDALGDSDSDAEWDDASEGRDNTEHVFDRTRNELSQLRSRIRLLRSPKA